MARRASNSEIGFGSDSFLDVIANLVGILIILIVVVGLRIRNTPADRAELDQRLTALETRKHEHDALWAARLEEISRARDADVARQEVYRREKLLREQESARRQRLAEQYAREQREYGQLRTARMTEVSQANARLAAMKQREQDLRERLVATQAAVARIEQQQAAMSMTAADRQQAAATLQKRRESLQTEVRSLMADLNKEQAAAEATQKEIAELDKSLAEPALAGGLRQEIKHYGLPIAEKVQKSELYFRLQKDAVAQVPLDELFENVKSVAKRHRFDLQPSLVETVGPIGGFRLRFRIGRADGSLVEQVNSPYSFRIELREWEVLPLPEVLAEPEAVALAEGSLFRTTIASYAPESYAITLFVYPDSFDFAKTLEGYLHERGFIVAFHPLPADEGIRGSPSGFRSVSR